MMNASKKPALLVILIVSFFPIYQSMLMAQQPVTESIVRQVDEAVKARIDNIAGYTVSEHYAVYRSNDENHPAAEMTVKTTYNQNLGKNYVIVSESGSVVIQNLILHVLLENEKRLNRPGIRENTWITSANYLMIIKLEGSQMIDGRACNALTLIPKRKAPYLFEGTLWVDSKDGSIVQLQGTASKSPSLISGPARVTRQYASIDGYSEATHARAVSDSSMFGETIVKIDYQDYQIQRRTSQ
jgi:hypothetical protein